MADSGRPLLTPRSCVVASRGQLSTRLSGEAVILGLADGVYYGLDGPGARIWELLQQPAVLADVAETVSAEFEVGREAATRDLLALTDDLLSRGLLEVVADSAP
jgi:sulfur transfer complex TusBCD TusB component (DsrH family)